MQKNFSKKEKFLKISALLDKMMLKNNFSNDKMRKTKRIVRN